MRSYLTAAAVAVALCTSFGVAEAESAKQACRADYQTFCSGTQPGGGRVLACLKQNFSKLSPNCQTALASMHSQQQ